MKVCSSKTVGNEEGVDMVCRSDSSAARSLAGRVGVGCIRQCAAGLLWLQQKVNEKELRVTGIPTSASTSDIDAKLLSKARTKGLKFLINRSTEMMRRSAVKSMKRSRRKKI